MTNGLPREVPDMEDAIVGEMVMLLGVVAYSLQGIIKKPLNALMAFLISSAITLLIVYRTGLYLVPQISILIWCVTFALLLAIFLREYLIPIVNEKIIFITNLLFVYMIFFYRELDIISYALLLPTFIMTLVMLFAVLDPDKIHNMLKAIMFGWYATMILVIAILNMNFTTYAPLTDYFTGYAFGGAAELVYFFFFGMFIMFSMVMLIPLFMLYPQEITEVPGDRFRKKSMKKKTPDSKSWMEIAKDDIHQSFHLAYGIQELVNRWSFVASRMNDKQFQRYDIILVNIILIIVLLNHLYLVVHPYILIDLIAFAIPIFSPAQYYLSD